VAGPSWLVGSRSCWLPAEDDELAQQIMLSAVRVGDRRGVPGGVGVGGPAGGRNDRADYPHTGWLCGFRLCGAVASGRNRTTGLGVAGSGRYGHCGAGGQGCVSPPTAMVGFVVAAAAFDLARATSGADGAASGQFRAERSATNWPCYLGPRNLRSLAPNGWPISS
jgi:hypothetical protein